MQVGSVVLLDVGDDLDAARLTEVLKRRLTSVSRLRQNLAYDLPAEGARSQACLGSRPQARVLVAAAGINPVVRRGSEGSRSMRVPKSP
jgi:hypothetical protein